MRFEVGTTPHGRMRARQVEVIRSRDPATRLPNEHPARWGTTSHLAIPAVLMVFAKTALAWRVPVRVRTGAQRSRTPSFVRRPRGLVANWREGGVNGYVCAASVGSGSSCWPVAESRAHKDTVRLEDLCTAFRSLSA